MLRGNCWRNEACQVGVLTTEPIVPAWGGPQAGTMGSVVKTPTQLRQQFQRIQLRLPSLALCTKHANCCTLGLPLQGGSMSNHKFDQISAVRTPFYSINGDLESWECPLSRPASIEA